ncbi:MAG: molybdenum cofactor guanylyltransferase, partial [candidate division Zixibacteria bacterium]|nr:molybdenum cofactor guanylyltransferase [candidate division Zixibacteria bacterium]
MTTAVILAGGRSRRFGSDKAAFEIRGRPMVSIVADVLGGIFDEVFVAGGEPQEYEKLGLVCFPDPVEGKGALGGVYNALSRASSEYIFCCGCDMPLIRRNVVGAITDHVG